MYSCCLNSAASKVAAYIFGDLSTTHAPVALRDPPTSAWTAQRELSGAVGRYWGVGCSKGKDVIAEDAAEWCGVHGVALMTRWRAATGTPSKASRRARRRQRPRFRLFQTSQNHWKTFPANERIQEDCMSLLFGWSKII